MLKWSIVFVSVLVAWALWVQSQKLPSPQPNAQRSSPIPAVGQPATTKSRLTTPVKTTESHPTRPSCVGPKSDLRPVLEICQNPTELQRKALEGLANQISLQYAPEQCEAIYTALRQKSRISLTVSDSLDPLKTITQLEKLEVMRVHTCDFSMLAEMKSLRDLKVYFSRFYDLTPLSKLKHLRRLLLPLDELDDLSPLVGLTELTELDIGGNGLSNIEPLRSLNKLISLDLFANKIKDIEPLTSLTNLQTLSLGANPLASPDTSDLEKQGNPLAPLEHMVSLKILRLDDVGGGTLKDLPNLQNLLQLERFEANENSISDLSPLSQNKALTWLSLKQNKIVDLSPLAGLSNLQEVYLQSNQINSLEAARSWKELSVLNIFGNKVEDVSPLSGLPKITKFQGQENPIKGILSLAKSPLLWDISVDIRLREEYLLVKRLYHERLAADPNHPHHKSGGPHKGPYPLIFP